MHARLALRGRFSPPARVIFYGARQANANGQRYLWIAVRRRLLSEVGLFRWVGRGGGQLHLLPWVTGQPARN